MTREQILSQLKGIFPPAVTPFDRRGKVDEGRFRENLKRYAGIGLGGVLVAGSTGEAPYLDERERLRLISIARDSVRAPELLVAGVGLESTEATIRLGREAIARGADVLLVLTPNYYKARMDGAALARHYRAVADAVTRPVVVYSIPQFTGITISAETLAALSRHPNVAGVKESSGNLKFVRSVIRRTRPGFRVLVGSVMILLDALRAGAAGAVLGQAGFVPELCVGVYDAYRRGRLKTARELQKRLVPLAERISIPYGVAGVKAALDLCGYHGGAPRPPLSPPDTAQRKIIAAALREARDGLDV